MPIGETTIKVSIHEDNIGELVLAKTLPLQFTSCSKYYASQTREINKQRIVLLKINTAEQLGDMFTKGLYRPTLEYIRKNIMDW